MTTDNQDEHLPISSFYFRLEWGSQDNLDFQEASGLQTEIEPIDYRKNDSAVSARKLPGMV
ncbi:MAG: phage tail protein, partial [Flavobacteriales bacterium]|nr:phage tail protein [Flavobacteriales bacterium]